MTSTIRSSVLLLAILATGCMTQPPRPVPLPLPARPTLQPLKQADLQCLSNSVYDVIVNRERGYKTWGLELEAIIQANNQKAAAAYIP